MPLVRPTIGAMALLAFLSTWNQYLWPNLITTETDMYTVQSGLRSSAESSSTSRTSSWPGVIIACLPIVVVLLIFQRQLSAG